MTAEVQAFSKHGVIIPELSTQRCHLILSPATCPPDPSWTMSPPILSHVWNGPSLSLLVLGRGSSFEFIYSLNPSVHLHFVTHRNDRVFFFLKCSFSHWNIYIPSYSGRGLVTNSSRKQLVLFSNGSQLEDCRWWLTGWHVCPRMSRLPERISRSGSNDPLSHWSLNHL